MWINCVITLILAGSTLSNAFWWPKTTTETREPSGGQMMQQIPLTYFRTYTYQPLAPGFFGFGAPQSPLLPGVTHQYDPYAQVTSYAAARRHDSAARQEVTAPSSTTSTTSTTPAPTTTTTTTTTTTPAPTTTTTTTSTTTPPPPPPPQVPQSSSSSSSSSFSEGSTSSLMRFGEYPTYNRRVSNLYNSRPQYPYPDYFNYQPPPPQQQQEQGVASAASRIQFVPCMCPVSMPSLVSSSTAATAPPHLATSPSTAFVAQPAARHIERQELEAEADGETAGEGEEEDEEEDLEEEQGQGQEEGASTSSIKPILD
ncbi:hypothetical protein KR084_000194 [Drosophila pseudotakahashii]|nr:hypothetical protein KR084_000194 [Drosophila pseudotakahashii]